MKKTIASVIALIILVVSGFFIINRVAKEPEVKNVILLIGDGMGPSYTTAYRYVSDDPETSGMDRTIFDEYLVGMAATYSDDILENITDSAAAATAMSAGIRTYNGAIAMDRKQQPVETVLEVAKKKGKSTGLVATSQINHATPAAFAAHNITREDYEAIADAYYDELINSEHKIDVMLGGGTNYFERSDRDLVSEFKESGYNYVTTKEDLLGNNSEKLLGLFAPVGLPPKIDRDETIPSLADMTKVALDQLNKNKTGFFLMVEGSQIDWAGHENDAVTAMSEMDDFARAFEVVIEFAQKNPNTQVVLTADHSTGGLSIGRDGKYILDTAVIQGIQRTPEFLANEIKSGQSVKEVFEEYIHYNFQPTDLRDIQEIADQNSDATEDALKQLFNETAGIGFTTDGHTGVDVPVYAYGPRTKDFLGHMHLIDIANHIFTYFE